MNRELQSYGTQQVMTSDPVTLVAMLYDKAVLCLKAAVQAIHKNEIEERWKNNSRAQEIINHLFMTLDLDRGGEIASNLEALYAYMLKRLLDVDVNNDARAAEEVIELLDPLRSSWRELAMSSDDFKMDPSEIDAVTGLAEDLDDRPSEPAIQQHSTEIGVDQSSPAAVSTVQISV
jgi:flagellar protein FliS